MVFVSFLGHSFLGLVRNRMVLPVDKMLVHLPLEETLQHKLLVELHNEANLNNSTNLVFTNNKVINNSDKIG